MNLKRSLHLSLLLLCTLATAAAEVPSLINYQGRLTGPGGTPASGAKNFELKIYDAQSGGNLLYSEDVGAITLGEGGVYSFQFGGSGTSNTQVTETLGNADGSVLYRTILGNTPAVAGSVSVTDGTYTWSRENGSSNEDDFSASFSTNLNRITVNYFAEPPPDDGRAITVTYRYGAEGIVGALSSGSGHWLQLSIDGEAQASRERVLAVPFAMKSSVAERALSIDESKLDVPTSTLSRHIGEIGPVLVDLVARTGNGLGLEGALPFYRYECFPRQLKVEDPDLPGSQPEVGGAFSALGSIWHGRGTHPGMATLRGRHGLIEQSSLLFGWTIGELPSIPGGGFSVSNAGILTTRSLGGLGVNSGKTQEEGPVNNFYIGGWLLSVEGSAVGFGGGIGPVVFYYMDGTVSEELIALPGVARPEDRGVNWSLPNPFPEKAVRFVTTPTRRAGRDGNGNPLLGTHRITFRAVHDTTRERRFDMRLEDLPDNLSGLNCRAMGSPSEGKNFAECLKWRIRYTDGTLSDPQDLGKVTTIAPGKTPGHVRVMTVPAILQDGYVDITSLTVWPQ